MKSEQLYSIKEFATMTALSQSTVRFYQKNGVIKPEQLPNGYFVYTKHEAFRINAFKMLLSYGYSVVEAVRLLDCDYDRPDFIQSLKAKKDILKKELNRIQDRIEMIDSAEKILCGEFCKFEQITVPTYFVTKVSDQDNFRIAKHCKKEVAIMAEYLGLTHYVRLLSVKDLLPDSLYWKPSYGMAISEPDYAKVFSDNAENLIKFKGGPAVRYVRKINRKNSEKLSSYQELFDYMKSNSLEFRGDILLFPSFFRLDSECNDYESLIVFLKK